MYTIYKAHKRIYIYIYYTPKV